MPDEIGELTEAFNIMVSDLAASREALMLQYRQVAALNEVARAISGATSLDEMLCRVLEDFWTTNMTRAKGHVAASP